MNIKANKHFKKEFLLKIEELLLKEKQELISKLEKLGKKIPDSIDDYDADYLDMGSDEDDNVHEIEEYSVNVVTEENLEKQLRDVNTSLKRLENGTYGICKYTGKPIEEKRLLARPTSSSSIEAKKYLQNT